MERRQALRASFERRVLVYAGNDRLETRGVNASARGLAFLSRAPRAAGEFLRIMCPLNNGCWTDADCIVARSTRTPDGQCLVGVFFTRMQPQLAQDLAENIARERPGTRGSGVRQARTRPLRDNDDSFDLFAQIPRTREELHALYREAVAEVTANERRPRKR